MAGKTTLAGTWILDFQPPEINFRRPGASCCRLQRPSYCAHTQVALRPEASPPGSPPAAFQPGASPAGRAVAPRVPRLRRVQRVTPPPCCAPAREAAPAPRPVLGGRTRHLREAARSRGGRDPRDPGLGGRGRGAPGRSTAHSRAPAGRAGRRPGTPRGRRAPQPPAGRRGGSGQGGGGAPEPPLPRARPRRAEKAEPSRAAGSPSGPASGKRNSRARRARGGRGRRAAVPLGSAATGLSGSRAAGRLPPARGGPKPGPLPRRAPPLIRCRSPAPPGREGPPTARGVRRGRPGTQRPPRTRSCSSTPPAPPQPSPAPRAAPPSPAGMLRLLALLLSVLPPPARAREPSAQDVSLGVDWLTRYGYLPPPHPAQAQLQSPAKLRDAIKVMQRFAGLPETGVLDSATMATMQKPRCSLPDVLGVAELVRRRRRRRRYALSGSMWRKRTLTWRVRSFPQSSALTQETVRTLMHHALTTWGVESGLKFQELVSQAPTEPDILIDFVRAYHQDSYPFDGQGGTLAHAFFPGEHPISGDTHFDDEETWTYRSKDGEGIDLFAVAVHEFGHALGLGHSSAPNSIMRPFYQGPVGDPHEYRLSQDDREGLQQLYGKVPQTPYDKPTRKPLAPPPPPPALPPDSPSLPIPDRCDGDFDAIANIRGEIFFFKGPWFWRLQPSGHLVSPRPARLHRFWEGLPAAVDVVQAAYARHPDGRILLFSGPRFWVFRDRQLEGAPRPLTALGLPAGEEVDAVFSWPLNGKTYLIRGRRYWRYDEAAARADPGYPRDLSLWEGAPHAPDDVTVSNTGDTYFFKGAHYWRFPKGSVKAEPDSPQPMGPKWLDCPAASADPRAPRPPRGTLAPGTCDCHCEINQASGRPSLSFEVSLLALLLGGVASV